MILLGRWGTGEQGEHVTLETLSPVLRDELLVPMHWPQVTAERVVQPAWLRNDDGNKRKLVNAGRVTGDLSVEE